MHINKGSETIQQKKKKKKKEKKKKKKKKKRNRRKDKKKKGKIFKLLNGSTAALESCVTIFSEFRLPKEICLLSIQAI